MFHAPSLKHAVPEIDRPRNVISEDERLQFKLRFTVTLEFFDQSTIFSIINWDPTILCRTVTIIACEDQYLILQVDLLQSDIEILELIDGKLVILGDTAFEAGRIDGNIVTKNSSRTLRVNGKH